MSRGPDAGMLLERALLAEAAAAGCRVHVVTADWSHWASATFTGARHHVVLEGADTAALPGWIAGLAEAELPLRRHLVADLRVCSVSRMASAVRITLEVLTVEER